MAILTVKIEDRASLWMNEFFDYAGFCWALSRSRIGEAASGAELEDFYEGTVRSSHMGEVPVLFIWEDQILGWYGAADVYRYIRHPALFLEGNICTRTRDARLLKQPRRLPTEPIVFSRNKNYTVIETDDDRYGPLKEIIEADQGPFEVIDYGRTPIDPRIQNGSTFIRGSGGRLTNQGRAAALLLQCEVLAREIMEDRCPGIGTVKGLFELAQDAARYDSKNVNAWYYLAMANYHLGFGRKGLKAIERALKLEPEGDDLLVMKANLLVSNGLFEEALRCYEEAFEQNPDESYLIMAGKACGCMGNPLAAAQYYRRVKDPEILKEFKVSVGRKKFR